MLIDEPAAGMSFVKRDQITALLMEFSSFLRFAKMSQRRGGDLSGGQQQLTIARAMIMCPKVLLMDKPGKGIQPNIFGKSP